MWSSSWKRGQGSRVIPQGKGHLLIKYLFKEKLAIRVRTTGDQILGELEKGGKHLEVEVLPGRFLEKVRND